MAPDITKEQEIITNIYNPTKECQRLWCCWGLETYFKRVKKLGMLLETARVHCHYSPY